MQKEMIKAADPNGSALTSSQRCRPSLLTVTRPQAMCGLYVLGVLNGITGTVVSSITSSGFWDALLASFDISVVLVLATMVGLNLTMRGPSVRISAADRLFFALYLGLLLVPIAAVSWAALTMLALYDLHRSRTTGSGRPAAAVAGASIFLAISVSAFWAKLIAPIFAPLLVRIDAVLVDLVLRMFTAGQVERIDNTIITGDQTLVVMIGCSSVHNVSHGLLCWLAITRAMRPAWRRQDLLAALFVCCVVIAVNILRMALMGLSLQSYLVLHGPVGEYATSILVLAAAAFVALHATGSLGPPGRRHSGNLIRSG